MEKNENKYLFNIDKEGNFSEWYSEIIKRADIVDIRYPIKGMNVWKGYGFKALKLMLGIMEELLDETGHEEVYFPLLIPESVFKKERDFLEGFRGEAYIVTHAGETKLKERLYVRPTSETPMYEMFSLWINSKSDLPLKIYQTVNVFRYETKQTRPLLRVRELVKFKEGHTAHATKDEADEHIKQVIDIYKKFFDELKVPYLILKTPEWDTFPGAEYNYDFISIMPDGKAVELGSVINLGQKFAKAFNIRYYVGEGKYEYVYQTCYGISERSLGVALSIHGDRKGLIFPSKIAPLHVVIVPILFSGKEEQNKKVLEKCNEIEANLKKAGFRVKTDASDKRPGEKFYYWEMKGVPIKIEVGPRDISNNQYPVSKRVGGEKDKVKGEELKDKIKSLLEEEDNEIKEKAEASINKHIIKIKTKEELEKYKKVERGLKVAEWCGNEKCAKKAEEIIDTPIIGYKEEKKKGKCIICGKEEVFELYFGRTY